MPFVIPSDVSTTPRGRLTTRQRLQAWELRERGLTDRGVMAKAFQLTLTDVERIDRMIAAADHQRDALLSTLARNRVLRCLCEKTTTPHVDRDPRADV